MNNKVLVIDDQQDNLISIKATIKSNLKNCEVLTALSGKEGIEIAKKEPIDTILLDIMMPQMNGYEVCKKLKTHKLTKHIPIIIITANKSNTINRAKALNSGADAFLSKPIDAFELKAQLKVMFRIKKTEDQLKNQNIELKKLVKERTQALTEAQHIAEIGSWNYDVNQNLSTWSDEMYCIFGVDQNEIDLSWENHKKLIHPDDWGRIDKRVNEALSKGIPYHEEFRIIRKNEQIIWAETHGRAIKDKTGKILKLSGTVQNITERKKADSDLNQIRQRLELSTQSANIGIWDLDLKNNILVWDQQMFDLYGIKPETFGGAYEAWKAGVHPDDIERSDAEVQEAIAGHKEFHTQFRVVWPDGQIRFIKAHATIVRDTTGKPERMIGVNWDITDRKQNEEKLKKSEELYRLTIQSAIDGFWIADTKGKLMVVNDAYCKMSGYSEEELLKMNIKDVEHNDSLKDIKNRIKKVIQTGGQLFESQHKTKSGQIIDVEVKLHFLDVDGGKLICFISEITKRKKSELELIRKNKELNQLNEQLIIAKQKAKEGEKKFRAYVEEVSIAIYLTDLNGDCVYVNNKWLEFTGMTFDEAIGKGWIKGLYEEDKKRISENWYKSVKSGGQWTYEYRLVNKKGIITWVEGTAKELTNSKGELVGHLGTNVNITDRKNAEEALFKAKQKAEESEARFKALHNASFGGITIHDKGIILECNKGLSEMTGYTRDELIGMDGLMLIAEESRKKVQEKIEEAYEEPYDALGIRKNGDKYPLRLEAREIPYNGKNVRVVEFRDITVQKKTEIALIQAKERAEESDRLKSAFLATISHELRTPLNAVIGFSDIIDEEMPLSDIIQFNQTINNSGKHLLSIVEDIFDITLIESGEINIKKEDVEVESLLQNIAQIIDIERSVLNKTHLNLNLIILPEAKNLIIHTDRAKLKQVLLNLLKNALKFTQNGTISYGFTIEKNTANPLMRFFVKDSGIGIAKNQQEFIFDTFRQLEDSNTRNYGGMGLGLAISKKITEMLGGSIWVESEKGKGSTFYFTIPYSKNDLEPMMNHKAKRKPKDGFKHKTILIVEDDKSSYEFLKVILESIGAKTKWAENGEQAISICKEDTSVDLVLMDINMPVMNGYKATKEIKKFKPQLPIIAQTAYAIAGDKEKSLEAGCDDYISKPIKKDLLFEKLSQFLNH